MVLRAAAGVVAGDELPRLTAPVTRADLVRYAGAAGDFNPIHWNERTARTVGLPDVIAHGMLTMALAGRLVTAWAGDPGAVVTFATRFTRPVVVPDDDAGTTLELAGAVTAVRSDGTVEIAVSARCAGVTVLGRTTAVVRLGGAS